jgi:hypothetical protein
VTLGVGCWRRKAVKLLRYNRPNYRGSADGDGINLGLMDQFY